MILIGAAGSGISQRAGKSIELIEIDMGNIEPANVTAAKAAVNNNYALLYINALIGIRKSEYDLFFLLKKYFSKIAVIYDRIEAVDGGDIETLRNDTCARFNIQPDNVLFIRKNDMIDETIGQKVKYSLCADIAAKSDDTSNEKLIETVCGNDECTFSFSENKNAVLIITLVMSAVILFLMFIKRGSKSKNHGGCNGFFLNNIILPSGIFALILILMKNSKMKEFINKIY